jgi:hypothetical protein
MVRAGLDHRPRDGRNLDRVRSSLARAVAADRRPDRDGDRALQERAAPQGDRLDGPARSCPRSGASFAGFTPTATWGARSASPVFRPGQRGRGTSGRAGNRLPSSRRSRSRPSSRRCPSGARARSLRGSTRSELGSSWPTIRGYARARWTPSRCPSTTIRARGSCGSPTTSTRRGGPGAATFGPGARGARRRARGATRGLRGPDLREARLSRTARRSSAEGAPAGGGGPVCRRSPAVRVHHACARGYGQPGGRAVPRGAQAGQDDGRLRSTVPARRRGCARGIPGTVVEFRGRSATSSCVISRCEGEDLNLHGNNPASTSTHRQAANGANLLASTAHMGARKCARERVFQGPNRGRTEAARV